MAARATATEFVDLQVQLRRSTGLRPQFPIFFSMPMSYILQPWQLLLMILASWVHREQQKVIEFYQA